MKVVWITGLPGSGKTTAIQDLRRRYELAPVFWTADDLASPEHKAEMGKQRIKFNATADLSIVMLGIFGHPTKTELSGTDLYTCVQRSRLKAVVGELAQRKHTRVIFAEGLMLLNKPFIQRLVEVSDVTAIRLTTPLPICQERFRTRNEAMVARGALKFYPSKFNHPAIWEKIGQRISAFCEAAHHVIEAVTSEDACRIILAESSCLMEAKAQSRRDDVGDSRLPH